MNEETIDYRLTMIEKKLDTVTDLQGRNLSEYTKTTD